MYRKVWEMPMSGNGPRVLAIWDDNHRICGIGDIEDQSAFDEMLNMAEKVDGLENEIEDLKDALSDFHSISDVD